MSKKTHHMAELKEQEKAKKPASVSVAPKKTAGGKKPLPAASKTAARGSAARAYERRAAVAPTTSVLYLRIIGGLMAAAALAGGIYWALNVGQNFTPWVIVGLMALGLLAGLGAFTAIRAKDVAARARAARRR